ncbi:MAG: hypothetical protein ABL933_13685 [Methyloglobulus sp.]|nr:hypothetical protein [Methyloglobulus sp.]
MLFNENDLSEVSQINYESIRKEFGVLNKKWLIYCALFKNPSSAKILWEASDLIYSVFIESLRDDFVITISRLTDKEKTGKNENSTLCRLHSDLKSLMQHREQHNYYDESQLIYRLRKESGIQKIKEFETNLEELANKIESIRTRRNKLKAHRDLKSIINEHEQQKNGNTEDSFDSDIKSSIETIEEIIKLSESVIFHASFLDGVVFPLKSPQYFIKNLEEGNKWREDYIKKRLNEMNQL